MNSSTPHQGSPPHPSLLPHGGDGEAAPLTAPACPHGGEHACLAPDMQRKLKLQATGRALLKDVRRLDLNYREYQFAEMILELSYGWGMESVIIPKLEIFSALTGVAKPHVSTNLNAMIEMGLLEVRKTTNGIRYSITTNRNHWRCRPKVSSAAVIEAITTVKMFNHLDGEPAAANEDSQGHPHFL